uniref:Uncharacterized protein n=1 Tax=Solanum lycopersicum TaxID=4081 RepID=A0A3Q7IKR2_SOLLC
MTSIVSRNLGDVQLIRLKASVKAMYSASVVDKVTVGSKVAFQLTTDPPRNASNRVEDKLDNCCRQNATLYSATCERNMYVLLYIQAFSLQISFNVGPMLARARST